MLYAIISDVHANLEALKAVLQDIKGRKIKDIVFIGDAVGYGPDPNECLDILSKKCMVMIAGNHDHAAVGLTNIEYFNQYARDAIEWTVSSLTRKSITVLNSLPLINFLDKDSIMLVHSTPKKPEEWHYLISLWDAEVNFNYFEQMFCFLGHSHQPFIIERLSSGEMLSYKDMAMIKKKSRYIINAGSVGQPRDRDPRACYAIIDDEKIEIIRVEYDIEKTQTKMKTAGLPVHLIERLAKGI